MTLKLKNLKVKEGGPVVVFKVGPDEMKVIQTE